MEFPKPPAKLLAIGDGYCEFEPAPELRDWAYATFIQEDGPLHNPDHEHLNKATILFVWSSSAFKNKGRYAVGTAQLGQQQGSLGKRELLEALYRKWNGGILPDFVITICAPYVAEASGSSICALIEHELYHCAQALDQWGEKRWTKDGDPVWSMRGHDVEEFVGVVARYGAHSRELQEMQAALNAGPRVKQSGVEAAVCGCGAKVA